MASPCLAVVGLRSFTSLKRALKSGRISLWPGVASTIGITASIGVGASVGGEGQAIVLGPTLSSWLRQQLNFGPAAMRILLWCGSAAAVVLATDAAEIAERTTLARGQYSVGQ
ncbi:MAG: chloride channel protein [Rhodospirillaceae bacterium]|nr:chloride channel protein [Rhodospirillaceae bacterium]